MNFKDYVLPIPLIVFDSTTIIPNVWNQMGPALAMPLFYLHFRNDSDVAVEISFNNADSHLYLPAGRYTIGQDTFGINSVQEIYFQHGAQPQNQRALLQTGTIIYITATGAGKAGSIYASGFFSRPV